MQIGLTSPTVFYPVQPVSPVRSQPQASAQGRDTDGDADASGAASGPKPAAGTGTLVDIRA